MLVYFSKLDLVYIPQVFDLNSGTGVLLEIPVKINRSLMINHYELMVVSHGNTLNLYEITVNSNVDESRYKLLKNDPYECLPFSENELISISISNNKHLIAIAGLKIIVVSMAVWCPFSL